MTGVAFDAVSCAFAGGYRTERDGGAWDWVERPVEVFFLVAL